MDEKIYLVYCNEERYNPNVLNSFAAYTIYGKKICFIQLSMK